MTARCLSTVIRQVRDTGWTHHIPRLMVLGSHALQRGWGPAAVTDWFHGCFVDGHDRVMLPNVVGMTHYADGGLRRLLAHNARISRAVRGLDRLTDLPELLRQERERDDGPP